MDGAVTGIGGNRVKVHLRLETDEGWWHWEEGCVTAAWQATEAT